MTPDQRLNQIEPELAEVLQKQDRLIEGQGQLVELVTTIKAELDQAKATGEITATGLARLTVDTQRQYEDLKAGQEAIMQYLREKLP